MSDKLGPGSILGRYELLAPVAKGGMAQVWMARLHGSRGFHKLVAVKTILSKGVSAHRSEAMLLEEARVAALIHHPNIVTTLDLGEAGGVLYLVMEWVHGETLGDVFHRAQQLGGIPLALAVNIIAQGCKGLHAAHEATSTEGVPLGLVHRDISPQNLLVSYSGLVKIADFGIAKAKVVNDELTQPGELKGKVAFMSPEQLASAPLDRRADLFAMGTLLYMATTGHHPFRGPTPARTISNIIERDPPRPSAVVKGYPPALEAVVLKALAKAPEKRWQTAAQMLDALVETQNALGGRYEVPVANYLKALMGDRERQRTEFLARSLETMPSEERLTPPPSAPRSPSAVTMTTSVARDSQPPSRADSANHPLIVSGTEDGVSTNTLVSLIRSRRKMGLVAAVSALALLLGAAAVKLVPPNRATRPDFVEVASRPTPTDVSLPAPNVSPAPTNSGVSPTAPSAPEIQSAAVGEQLPSAQSPTAPIPTPAMRLARVVANERVPKVAHSSVDGRRTSPSSQTAIEAAAVAPARTVNAWDPGQFGGRN